MLERKLFGKIETISEAVWWNFFADFVPDRLRQMGLLNFFFRVQDLFLPRRPMGIVQDFQEYWGGASQFLGHGLDALYVPPLRAYASS